MRTHWKGALRMILVIVAVAAPALTAETEEAAKSTPKITVEEPIADLGIVVKGETVSHEFVIRNTGDAPLELSEVRPACGCTVVEFDPVIEPGATGKIHATLSTARLRGGGGSKGISVFTNDPENPRVQLTLQAKLRDYLVFNPGFARFIKGKGYGPGVVTQILFAPKFDDLEILGIESPFPFLKVDYRPATKEEHRNEGAANQYVLTLTLDYSKAPVGPLIGNLAVHTNHPKQKTTWLPVSGFVRPLVAVTPAEAHYGKFEHPEKMTTNFIVKSYAPFDVKVTEVSEDLEGATVTVVPIEEGKSYNVQLSFDPEMPKGKFAGKLEIHTDSKIEPVIRVKLTGEVL